MTAFLKEETSVGRTSASCVTGSSLSSVSCCVFKACHFRAAVLEEKSAALHALGAYAEHASGPFKPYVERSLKLVLQMCEYYHDTIREGAYTVLADILQATEANFPPPGPGSCHFPLDES